MDLDSDIVKGVLAGIAIIGVLLLLAYSLKTIEGNGDGGGEHFCPPQLDSVTCGYCPENADSSHAGKCRTCPSGTTCVYNDICGDIACAGGSSPDGGDGSSGGSGTTYYVSCSGCKYGQTSYSYRGSYSTCNYWYKVCVQAECSKILDNCR